MDKNEKIIGREIDIMGFVICAERVSRYLKGKCNKRLRGWKCRVYISRGLFSRFENRV